MKKHQDSKFCECYECSFPRLCSANLALFELRNEIECNYLLLRQSRRCIAGQSGPEYDRLRAQELAYKDCLRRLDKAKRRSLQND